MLERYINNARENSLTAAVFSHLLHLPSEMFWQILCKGCYTKNLPDYPGEPELIWWPSWDAKETGNPVRVEPDLFMRFSSFDLIIEAKRWDNGMQDTDQWTRELIAYTNVYGKDKRSVRMIALGGIHSENDGEVQHESVVCPVHMCRWSGLLHKCQCLKIELEKTNHNNPSSRVYAYIRILNDLTAFFEVHGFPALKWFLDFDFKSNLLDDTVESDRQYFQNISNQFQKL